VLAPCLEFAHDLIPMKLLTLSLNGSLYLIASALIRLVAACGRIQLWVIWGTPKGLHESRIRFSCRSVYSAIDVNSDQRRSALG